MGNNQRSSNFLKECMADALIRLMQEKEFDKVTVNEIAEVAGVNRSTWFRNFSSKNEALTFKLVQMWLKWVEDNHIAQTPRFSLDNAETFFSFNYSIRDVLEAIYKANQQVVIHDAFYQIMSPQKMETAEDCYTIHFLSYGLFGFLDEWVRRGFSESPKTMSLYITRILTEFSVDYVK